MTTKSSAGFWPISRAGEFGFTRRRFVSSAFRANELGGRSLGKRRSEVEGINRAIPYWILHRLAEAAASSGRVPFTKCRHTSLDVRLGGHTGLDLLTLSSSHFAPGRHRRDRNLQSSGLLH